MNSKDKRLRDETVRSCRAVVRLVSGREGGEGEETMGRVGRRERGSRE